MNKTTKNLIIILLILIIIKVILSVFVLSPSAFSDEYAFAKMARSFFNSQEFTVHGIQTRQYFPLYPMILSIAYFFKDMQIIYLVMKIINSILSSLIIIPAFLLAKEFLSEKKALLTALIVSLYPSIFSFFPMIMPENLYYTLFLTSIYFIYKLFTEKGAKWSILTGISIALTTLTKINGIILVGIIGILYLYQLIKKEFKIKDLFITSATFVIIILPWIIRNILLFGFSLSGILGGYSDFVETAKFSLPSLIIWIIIYIGIIILSTGFIYFILNLINNKEQDKKLKYFRIITLLSCISAIILAANANAHGVYIYKTLLSWLTWRPVTRTIDVIAPLILINGIINLKYIQKLKIKSIFLLIPILLITTQIIFFPLFPTNNMSLVLLGGFGYLLNYLSTNLIITTIIISIILIGILFSINYLLKKNKINFKSLVILTLIFFLLSNIANCALITYNANTYWYKDNQMQMGLWFNDYDKGKSTVLIDDKDEGTILKIGQTSLYEKNHLNITMTKIGFFMNNNILIGNINNLNGIDYVLTKNKLDLTLIKQEGDIFLYKKKVI